MGGYILNRNGIETEEKKTLYRQGELELMTTHQLREICRREKIVQGILNPMDKEELVHVILRFRGTREQLLIMEEEETGNRAVGQMLHQGRITVLQDRTAYQVRKKSLCRKIHLHHVPERQVSLSFCRKGIQRIYAVCDRIKKMSLPDSPILLEIHRLYDKNPSDVNEVLC